MERIFIFLWVPKFWNMSQNLNNVINGYKPVQSHRTCGFYCNEVPYLSSDLRSQIWNYVPGFVKYLRSCGLNNTLGISCHSDPFLKDLSLLSLLPGRQQWWELGRPKAEKHSAFFQSVFGGGKGLLTLGLLECPPCEQTTQSGVTWHLKGCREKCSRRHYSCLGALRQNSKLC